MATAHNSLGDLQVIPTINQLGITLGHALSHALQRNDPLTGSSSHNANVYCTKKVRYNALTTATATIAKKANRSG